jgi:glucose 1-dehydrogenase
VNVSSVHAVATSPNVTAYAASKGALLALTRAAAIEMAPFGVRVNAVLPGAVDTPMLRAGVLREDPDADVEVALKQLAERTPLRLVGDPSDIAEGILFLADGGRSRFVTGQVLVIDGGATACLSTERE